jgi:hypothetical protein
MSADSHRQMQRDPNLSYAGDPRVAASVVLVGIVAVLIGAVFMAIGPELKANGPATAAASGGQRATPVRIVGVPAREDATCGQQVWPNIDQRCLVPVKRETAADNRPAVTPDDTNKLSPLTATGPVGKNLPNSQGAAAIAPAPDKTNVSAAQDVDAAPARSYATVGFANDEPEEAPVRKPVRRHIGFPFPFGFRF